MSPLFGGRKGGDEPSGGGSRSTAEREAARLERERRRAEREGRPLPPEPMPSDGTGDMSEEIWAPEPPVFDTPPPRVEEQAAVEPQAFEPAPPPVEDVPAAEPDAFDPAPPAVEEATGAEPREWEAAPPAVEEATGAEPREWEAAPPAVEPHAPEAPPAAAEPDAFDPAPPRVEDEAAAESREWDAAPPAAEPETQAWDVAPAAEPHYEVPFEPLAVEEPAGVRRVASVAELPQVGGPRPTPPGPVRGPAGQRQRKLPKPRGVPRGRRMGRRFVALLFLAVAVVVLYGAYRVFQPGHDAGDAKRPVAITIPQGATASEIADELKREGVIDSSFYFNIRSRVSGQRADLKAGRFTLRKDMSYAAALDALTKNPANAPTVTVTIPEGRSIGEAAPLIRQAGLTGSYLKAATRNPRTVTGLKTYNVTKGTNSLEGFLFPATYELKKGSKTATASALVTEQLAAFKQNFDRLDRKAAHAKHLTDYDILIIASMIEREAQVAKDRPLISAVIYNRLKDHIPLGIDATIRYRLNNWSKPLKVSELQMDSAFNTRTHQGLPPTPIGSPGLASIKAALHPAKVGYLYYVVKPGGHGAHAFSSTAAQFQKDVDAYNKARAKDGGKDPAG